MRVTESLNPSVFAICEIAGTARVDVILITRGHDCSGIWLVEIDGGKARSWERLDDMQTVVVRDVLESLAE